MFLTARGTITWCGSQGHKSLVEVEDRVHLGQALRGGGGDEL